jgi:hypothetical protein
VFLHRASLSAGIVARQAAEGFESRVNPLMDFEFVKAVEALFTKATNEGPFTRVNQEMTLEIFGVFRQVSAT